MKWSRPAALLATAAVVAACGGHGTRAYPVGADTPPTVGEQPAPLAPSRGAVFYVAPDGSDAAAGTANAPWHTLQKAVETVRPGQTVVMRPGVYSEDVEMAHSGTAQAPITIRGQRGAVLTAGTGESQNVPLMFSNAAGYIRVTGLTIQGATGDSTADVYASVGAHDIELTRCDIRRSARQGIFADRTTYRIAIIGNTIHDNGGSGPKDLDHNIYLEGRNQVVLNNLIANAPNGSGVQLYPESEHAVVAHNTVVSNRLDGIILGSAGETSTYGAVISNNIVALNGRYGISTYWGGPVGNGNVVRRNLAWRNSSGEFVGKGVAFSENRVANPEFVDPSAGDWRSRIADAGA